MCRKQAGIAIGRLCDKCDGKCPVCDSYVRPTTLVRICDECSFGNYQNKCVVCGGEGISDAFYCFECTRLEKDRDGCPKIINLGSSRTDVSLSTKLILLFLRWQNTNKSLHAAILPEENKPNNALALMLPGFGHIPPRQLLVYPGGSSAGPLLELANRLMHLLAFDVTFDALNHFFCVKYLATEM